MRRRVAPAVTVPMLMVTLTAGCLFDGPGGTGAGGNDRPDAQHTGGGQVPGQQQSFVRDGLVGNRPKPFQLEVKAVARHPDYTMLQMELVYIGEEESEHALGTFSAANTHIDRDLARFRLLDPVGGKYYRTLREGGSDGDPFGSYVERGNVRLYKGVRYPVRVYFPALPPQVERVTVLPPGSFGEMTGIPVTDGGPAVTPQPTTSTDDDPQPGSVYYLPVREPGGDVWSGGVYDLHEYVEHPQTSTVQGGEEETIAVRADVLFAFDKADLSDEATTVLDDVAAETRQRADPDKPPIVVEGHTDSKGSSSYNQELSVRRARAVRDYLADRLGGEYVYEVTGKGESEPIAEEEKEDGSDNPDGRARNRRVEISYRVKDQTPGETVSPGPSPGTGQGSVQGPAEFRKDAGPVAGTLDITTKQGYELRVDVHPFYRDGAYLIGVFDVVNVGDKDLNYVFNPFNSWDTSFVSIGATFGGFSVVDPQSKTRYFAVRAGPADADRFVEAELLYVLPEMTTRAFVYYPAPPDDVSTVSFDLEDGGTVEDIPIK